MNGPTVRKPHIGQKAMLTYWLYRLSEAAMASLEADSSDENMARLSYLLSDTTEAIASGGDAPSPELPPVPTWGDPECRHGWVWDPDQEMCVRPSP